MPDSTIDPAPLYPPTVRPPDGGLPFFAYVPALIANPIRVVPESVYNEPVVPYRFLATNIAWVTAPELIEQVLLKETDCFVKSPLEHRVLGPTLGNGLLTASGETWRWQRKIAAPLFRHADVLSYVPAMTAAAESQLAKWRAAGRSGRFTTDVELDMRATTFEVIATTILAGCNAAEAQSIQHADSQYMGRVTWEMAAAVLKLPGWMWYPNKVAMRNAARDLRAAVLALVARRRGEMAGDGPAPDDILTRLIAARDPDTGAPMDDTTIVDNLATFLEAGHQTTAQALTWTLYLLARAPAWQDRVRAEIVSACGDEPVGAQHIAALPVTMRVLKESMRLYPPVPAMVRHAAEDVMLGEQRIAEGTLVVIPVFAVHRHRTRWQDSNRFDPDRFLPEREAAMHRAQYLPFGFGPRTCLGMPFATIEGVAILATLLRHARFVWDGRHLPEPLSQVTLRPKGGMPLQLELL